MFIKILKTLADPHYLLNNYSFMLDEEKIVLEHRENDLAIILEETETGHDIICAEKEAHPGRAVYRFSKIEMEDSRILQELFEKAVQAIIDANDVVLYEYTHGNPRWIVREL